MSEAGYDPEYDIAVVGMSGRFPQAPDVASFWSACRDGVECVTRWEGPSGAPGRVLAGGLLSGQDLFDAEAFGMAPAEAELLDPQHRLFLEICWEALEAAAVVPGGADLVSVYAAAAPSLYNPLPTDPGDENARYQQMIANSPDFLATRVSYLLDLRGEAINVQTACSSSLVAVHMACQSLRSGQSDVALAGGVSVNPDQHLGYVHQKGMIASPDGRCLPFDAQARGAVPGNGGAVVVLQRLGDALASGRPVHAIVRGSAVNNDGRAKSGFMAPNTRGQSEAIATALAAADVPAESIGYLEAHGTGTRLGDPIELQAARSAFGLFTDRTEFCALGSLKANFGHLDRAAGVAGLVKAVHVVQEGVIPPLVGFDSPNPELDLEQSPFRVPRSTETGPWPTADARRAGVSSFGVGGTNAHVIVENYSPAREPGHGRPAGEGVERAPLALPLSAHSPASLARSATNLAAHVEASGQRLSEVAHTLTSGRRDLAYRTVAVAGDRAGAARALSEPTDVRPVPGQAPSQVFLFPGQGAEVVYRPQELCARFPVFEEEVGLFADAHGMSSRELLAGVSGDEPEIRALAYQPSLIAVQVALARLLEELGVTADALCGSSVGEYAAAYMSGVFDREELMRVLAARDRLMRATPEGRMMAAPCSAEKVADLLLPGMKLAGDNAAERVLLSGPADLVERQRSALLDHGIEARVLPGRIAPHSSLMTEAGDELRHVLSSVRLRPAQRPLVSTLTGTWIEPGEMERPDYWVRHLCQPIRFRKAMETLGEAGHAHFIEASPGDSLTKLVRRNLLDSVGRAVTVGPVDESPLTGLLRALGEVWTEGTPVDWESANGTRDERFGVLPGYPFQRRRLWNHVSATANPSSSSLHAASDGGPHRVLDAPTWRPEPAVPRNARRPLPSRVAVRAEDGDGLGAVLAARLADAGVDVTLVPAGSPSPSVSGAPGQEAPVLVDLTLASPEPAEDDDPVDRPGLTAWLERGLLRPLRGLKSGPVSRMVVVTRGFWPVLSGERGDTRPSAVIGLLRCAPHEWPGLTTSMVDLEAGPESAEAEIDTLLAELAEPGDHDLALRGGVRYRRFHEPATVNRASPLKEGGTYLLLGGTGRLGPVVAEAISSEVRATIVVAGRDPDRSPSGHGRALLDSARERGCTIVLRALDAADPVALEHAVDELTAEHGRVDGVFHLAAHTAVEDFPLLTDLTPESAVSLTEAKVMSAAALRRALGEHDYDFVVLFSSVSTIIGALRFGAYASSNAYLDALAVEMSAVSGRRWISAVWDGWSADGIASTRGLGSLDGAELLRRTLRAEQPVVVPAVRGAESQRAAVRAELAEVAEAARLRGEDASGNSTADAILLTVREISGHQRVDLRQSFAGLGIDSLQMMQIAARLRPLLGEHVSLGGLLSAGSVADIVALAEADVREPAAAEAAARVGKGTLSSVQQRLWYLHQLTPDSSDYNVPFGWVLPGGTTVEQARGAVREVLLRHDVLRSGYRPDEEQVPRRFVGDVDDTPVEEVVLDPRGHGSSFGAVARAFVDRPIDLASFSTRVLIAHGPETPVHILFVCHHASVDAWSIKIIQEDLESGLEGGTPSETKPRGSYRDFVQWEHDLRAAPGYEDRLDYWKGRLEGLEPTVPPADAEIAEDTHRRVAVATRLLSPETLEKLRRSVRAADATLYTAGLTGLALALSRWCGGSEVVIGTNLANRARADFEDIVGMFVDPVVLRLAPGEDAGDADGPAPTLDTALRRTRAVFGEALTHSDVPYLDLVHHMGSGGGDQDNPLFSVIATMFDTESGGGNLEPLDVPLPTRPKFPLAVEFLPRGDGLLIHALYAADRYLPATVERLLGRVARFLELLAEQGPDTPLKELFAQRDPAAPGRFTWRS
ncbi:beta-ketoacyl synthase N-terminal-like domain-containing protein [Nocardiopsis synnemataformans]|uniref:beta-ketoacyl synthase N-terminal-like domain-containing protein n=1 Tax=Nocardiopsis synnemataformans TaxID=61305 RepID=UPI003EBF72A4